MDVDNDPLYLIEANENDLYDRIRFKSGEPKDVDVNEIKKKIPTISNKQLDLKPSTLGEYAGLGVFALRHFDEGEIITIYSGPIFSKQEFIELIQKYPQYETHAKSIVLGGQYVIVGNMTEYKTLIQHPSLYLMNKGLGSYINDAHGSVYENNVEFVILDSKKNQDIFVNAIKNARKRSPNSPLQTVKTIRPVLDANISQFKLFDIKDRIVVVRALNDIEEGQELFVDYGSSYRWDIEPLKCRWCDFSSSSPQSDKKDLYFCELCNNEASFILNKNLSYRCENHLNDHETPISYGIRIETTEDEQFISTNLHDDMRTLWIDHIMYTRCFIISVAHNIPDEAVTLKRLLKNQKDLGNMFRFIYNSQEIGGIVTYLLTEHIKGAGALIKEVKNKGNNIKKLKSEWYKNANDIANALYTLNKDHWKESELISLMKRHLDDTLDEAVNRLEHNYIQDIDAFDRVYRHILIMSYTLSEGIMKQFPGRFDDTDNNNSTM
jgi:hypothetical protein